MSQVSISIQGTFDVAKARNILRKEIAKQGWLPAFSARSAAALTEMTGLILLSRTSGVLDIQVVKQPGLSGIELGFNVHWWNDKEVWLDQARGRLRNMTDELEIHDNGHCPRIVARLWLA
jgi:hypothetical protein